jgi:outer membrane protein assembly factor BamC
MRNNFGSSMKASNISVLTLIACALAACSSAGSEKNKLFDYKAAAIKVRSLEVPPDLTPVLTNDRYGIPGSTEEGVRYSDFSKGKLNGAASDVLPASRTVRLVRNGNQRWLEVSDKAENIWPLVKAFWLENGLSIQAENPQAGIFETEWAENRAKVHNDGMRYHLGGALEGLYSSAEKDQYHTRLERSQDGKSTEITIKHNGLQELPEPDKNGNRWLTRPGDPELEATMLQLLMAKLGGAPSPSAVAQQPAALPEQAVPRLQTLADGSKSILLSEPFDKSWRKVSLALEQAGIALEDKDRSKGVFFLKAAKNKGASATDTPDAYQVNVRENSAGCEVSAGNVKGASTPDTQRIIDALYQQLSKQ